MHDRVAKRRRDAEDHRRYRARRNAGKRIARVLVDEVALAETLVRNGLISQQDVEDTTKVDAALGVAVAHWVETT